MNNNNTQHTCKVCDAYILPSNRLLGECGFGHKLNNETITMDFASYIDTAQCYNYWRNKADVKEMHRMMDSSPLQYRWELNTVTNKLNRIGETNE